MRRLITQEILDTFWPLHEAGETIAKAAKAAGISEALGRDIARFNRRYAADCDPERKAEVVAEFHRRMKHGMGLWDAARMVGLTFADAMAERAALLAKMKAERPPSLKPAHVTAEEYTREWYLQQDFAFGRAMLAAHPELFKEVV